MSEHEKVIWYEGMNLEPHHFQQWDRFHQHQLHSRVRSLSLYDWGFAELSIDRDAVTGGQFKLQRCRGITPDGLGFDLPEEAPLPPARDFREAFSATRSKLDIYLALPAEHSRGQNCTLNGNQAHRETRYRMEEVPRVDDNTGMDERSIGVGYPNFRLLLEEESREHYTGLKIAEITRTPDGNFAVSSEYVPPSLYLDVAAPLINAVRNILGLLVARSNTLMASRRYQATGQLEIGASDIARFWLLHTVNGFIPLLNHHITVGKYHPVQVFSTLLMLAGQLTTFSTNGQTSLTELPAYDHHHPLACFSRLQEYIKGCLGEVVPRTNYVKISLDRRGETAFMGKIDDATLLQDADFYLMATHELPEQQVAESLPRTIRIASPEVINEVLGAATTALPLEYTPRPPAGIPHKPGVQYFHLKKEGYFWETICTSKALVIYLPGGRFPGLQLELIAVRPG
ncbi:MAG: type VI secretion system baseplate subunit TssK [Calditrichaeota bacterium]|nr:MAG: type VI secretion system baseplate subunit TssK [Calditrichota bacterium]